MRFSHIQALRVARGLLIAGILQLLPGACFLVASGPTEEDVGAAFNEVARIGLESLKPGAPIRLSFRVPDTAQWARIREALGASGYIALGVQRRGRTDWILPFSTLGLDLKVTRPDESISLESARYAPYGYSSSSQGDYGMVFKPRPGDELEVTVTTQPSERLPAGHFVIEPYWDGKGKDFIVGAMLESDSRPYILTLAIVGIAMLIASAVLAIGAARNVERQLTPRRPESGGK